MLTVRHIALSGHETILETKRVATEPSLKVGGGPPVFFYEAAGEMVGLTSGVVYVMNEAGRTIAKYDLGEG